MKAIETKWKGYRFRSRTEARWAVFFETAGIDYEYEPEGYILPSGAYLPDFRLRTYVVPGAAGGTAAERLASAVEQTTIVEIKGTTPTTEEVQRCGELRDHLARDSHFTEMLIAVGSPDIVRRVFPVLSRYTPDGDQLPGYDIIQAEPGCFAAAGTGGAIGLNMREMGPGRGDWLVCPIGYRTREEAARDFTFAEPSVPPWMQAAYDAARYARFEFGQTDQRWVSE